jgi:sugar transferase (PEP-CTERM/EpsH1 system associated)
VAPLSVVPGASVDARPLIAHVVYRFAVGGLENGVVNLINHMPHHRWRHVVVSLTDVDAAFAARIRRQDVRCLALQKRPGSGLHMFPRLWRLFRELRPDVVHTRNLAALEMQAPAWAAGVPGRVHGEHGREADDVQGLNRRNILTRRAYRPFVQHTIALGQEITGYVRNKIGVREPRLHTIYNGVDTVRFHPAESRQALEGSPFNDPSLWVVGTVGRMLSVKAQPLLAKAFAATLLARPDLRTRLRLVLVGDGPLRAECEQILQAAGLMDLAWFSGERSDVPDVMRSLNCFALPSLVEGISNTILEGMASGLPVLATQVGANAELVGQGITGLLVPPGDAQALSQGLQALVADPAGASSMGRAGRVSVEQRFSLQAMVAAYEGVYDLVTEAPARRSK